MAKIDLAQLNERVEKKLISKQKHPDAELYIYNYTAMAQYGREWDEYTLQARGLILDADGNIVARPFGKFFNLEEDKIDLPNEPFEVHEKMDGSLGILYWANGKPYIATRGSFTSEQALAGSAMLRQYHKAEPFNPDLTYLFEIIYPQNRIVVDYGDTQRLVLLAVIETETGKELGLDFYRLDGWDVAQHYDGITDLATIREVFKHDNSEGFVVRFTKSNLRVKLKYEEYVRLHRLLTQVSSKSIWELLKNKQRFDELLDNVPDEFYGWVRATAQGLEAKYYEIFHEARGFAATLDRAVSRRELAETVKGFKYPGLVFSMLDGKDTWESIWKMIKPKYEQPFKKDIDA